MIGVTGPAFSSPSSSERVTSAENGDIGPQKALLGRDSPGNVEAGRPFYRVLRKMSGKAGQKEQAGAVGDQVKGLLPEQVRKLKDKLRNGIPNVRDVLMFLQQWIQRGGISRKELSSLLSERVIPALERGGGRLQELAGILRNAERALAKEASGAGKLGMISRAKEGMLPLTDAKNSEKSGTVLMKVFPPSSDDLKSVREWLGETIKDLKILGNERKYEILKKPLRNHFQTDLSLNFVDGEGKSPERSIFKGVPILGQNEGGQETGHSVLKGEMVGVSRDAGAVPWKDGMHALIATRVKSVNPRKEEKNGLEFQKTVQGIENPILHPSQGVILPETAESLHAPELPVVNQIIQAINLAHQDGHYTMRIALRPPHLGNIDVALTVKGHHVQANFSVESPVTHEILTHQLPELRVLLAQQGLTMKEVSVQVGGGSHQGFRPFNGSPQEFSGRGKGRGPILEGMSKIEEEVFGRGPVNPTLHGALSRDVDHINIFA